MRLDELFDDLSFLEERSALNRRYPGGFQLHKEEPFVDFVRNEFLKFGFTINQEGVYEYRDDMGNLVKNSSEEVEMLAGAYGLVLFNKQKNYVVKIFKEDQGYMKWINYCIAHKGHPNLPTFIRNHVTKLTVPGAFEDFYMVRIEKLVRLNDYFDSTSLMKHVDELDTNKATGQENLYDHRFSDWLDNDFELQTLLRELFEGNLAHDVVLDLHRDNLMMNPNTGRVQITDPWH